MVVGSALSDVIGVTSAVDLFSLMTFLLVVYGVLLVRKVANRLEIHHGVRSDLSSMYGLAEALTMDGISQDMQVVLARAIAVHAKNALEQVDTAVKQLGES